MENFLMSSQRFSKGNMLWNYLPGYRCACTYLFINLHIIQVVRRSWFTQNWPSKCFIFLQSSNDTFERVIKICECTMTESITKYAIILNTMKNVYLWSVCWRQFVLASEGDWYIFLLLNVWPHSDRLKSAFGAGRGERPTRQLGKVTDQGFPTYRAGC